MSDSILHKRKFLIAGPDDSGRASLAAAVGQQIDRAGIVTADDGLQALQKIENDLPHIVIADAHLTKLSGYELTERLLRDYPKSVAVILLTELPDTHDLADAVATGQLQFLAPAQRETHIGACLVRALNWLARGDKLEFTVRFLAKGDYLMRQGEIAESVYILKRGSMKAFAGHGSSSQPIGEHGRLLGDIAEREFVGEMAYINGDVRSADVIADSDCELIEIPILHLDRLLFQRPAWAMALMKTLSKRMRAANDQRVSD